MISAPRTCSSSQPSNTRTNEASRQPEASRADHKSLKLTDIGTDPEGSDGWVEGEGADVRADEPRGDSGSTEIPFLQNFGKKGET